MRLATGFILFTLGAVMLAWELLLLQQKLTPISVVMKDAALASCLLPFGWGLMGGHWWVVHDLWDRSTWFAGWPLWVAVACALAGWDVWMHFYSATSRPEWHPVMRVVRYPGLWLLVGAALGAFAWPQRAIL